jgi:hypothetical protein
MHPPGAGQESWARYVSSNAAFSSSTGSRDAVACRAGVLRREEEDDSSPPFLSSRGGMVDTASTHLVGVGLPSGPFVGLPRWALRPGEASPFFFLLFLFLYFYFLF